MPDRYRVETMPRGGRVGLVIVLGMVIVLATGPWWLGRAEMRLGVEICSYLALATMWNLLAGYAGLVSVGQQAFVGIGGYALFALAAFAGLHPLLALVAAGAVAALLAIPTAALAFRLQGAYFAIGTWVIAEVYMLSIAQIQALGGGSGMSLPVKVVKEIAQEKTMRESIVYWIALALAVGSVAAVYWLLRSRHGLALTAIRDSEPAAKSVGVDNARTKYLVYVLAAFITGLAGALIFLAKLRISPEAAFDVVDWTAYVIFIVVIGGVGRIEGPIVGTIVFFALRHFLADLGSIYLIILGLLAVVVMLKAPAGLWGLVLARTGFELFPVQRRLIRRSRE
ncbi:MAG: branched-chain amino acid ABC transporter permease [Ectothiorhodospiraceae bacterium AqS1]|nr:branched-chain amino acid ABC transporter permease [Ectothiorhodospiraceae bacterium AqS1]